MGQEGSWAGFRRKAVGTPKQVLLPPARDAGRPQTMGPREGESGFPSVHLWSQLSNPWFSLPDM